MENDCLVLWSRFYKAYYRAFATIALNILFVNAVQ